MIITRPPGPVGGAARPRYSPNATMTAYEKVAILAWGVDQHRLYLARPARAAPGSILGCGAKCELLVAAARHCRLFRSRVGARLALALPAQAHQEYPHPHGLPDHDHRLHG